MKACLPPSALPIRRRARPRQPHNVTTWRSLLKMRQDLPDHRRVLDAGDDLHRTAAGLTGAGKEASGTGNMKFMMNGAITIGTLDGANIEIMDEVGEENFFLFGLTADQVAETRRDYRPRELIAADQDLNAVMKLLQSGHFNQFERHLFDDITCRH